MTGRASRGILWCTVCIPVLAGACASAGDRRNPVTADPFEASSVNEDSLAAVARAYSELDAGVDAGDTVDNEAVASTAAPPRHAASDVRRSRRGPALDLQVIGGRRSQYEARANMPGNVALGVKTRNGTGLGFATYRGHGFIRAVHVGNLALHMGERLVLGRRGGRFPPSVWSPVRGGVRVAPSLSSWFGQNGLAVATGWRGWETRSIAVIPDGGSVTAAALWLALNHSTSNHGIGAAWGRQLRKDPHRQRPNASTVVSLHGSLRHGTLAASAEVAGFAKGNPFVAARVTHRGISRWSLFVYNAPTFSTHTKPARDFGTGKSVRRGARLELRGPLARGNMILSLWVGSSGSPETHRRFRRAVVEYTGGRHSLKWRGVADWVLQRRDGYRGSVFPEPFERHEQTARFKAALRLDYAQTNHDLGVQYLPALAGHGSGLMTTASGSAEVGRVQASWRVTAYSLAPGRTGFLGRPGVAGFEAFSTVSGQGSDLSARLRVRLGPTVRVFIYYGVPHLETRRVYMGMRLRM